MAGFPWGGSEELWADMADYAVEQSHELTVSVLQWPEPHPKIKNLSAKGVKFYFRNNPGMETQKRRSKVVGGLARKVVTVRKRWRKYSKDYADLLEPESDIVCISQGATYDILSNRDLADSISDSNIPFVLICQFNSDDVVPSSSARQRAIDFYKRAHRVIFVSDANRKTAERQLAIPLSNAVILKNPVNLTDITPVSWPAGSLSIANVARLDARYKGQDLMLEAFSASHWSERDWTLNLYGTGPDKEYLASLASFYGIDKHVRWHGQVSDVRKIWAENHILAMPSRAEGTPLALIEAMLCARPAVVTDVGGMAEWIEDGKTGFIADAATPKLISKSLERAWERKDEWSVMGEIAHKVALQRIDKSPGRTLLNLVEKVVAESDREQL